MLQSVRNEYNANGVSGVLNKTFKKIFGLPPEKTKNDCSYLKYEEVCQTEPDVISISRFKNKYSGKRCFIVGNGPSLNKLDLKKLDGEYTFAVNGIFYKTEEMGFVPTFYMVEDGHVIDDNLERINSYRPKIHRFFPTEYKNMITRLCQ